MPKENYTDVLLEDIRSQIQAALEIVSDNQRQLADMPKRDEFNELKADVKIIKQAVKDTNVDLRLLERRVIKLEQTRA